ncbi:Nitrogen permease regulator 3 [Entomophthora muscae]|uniref:Nitrogen permease regulator 3 n=2 Tax=Entomophthora muscae TaxID=34485 RepID=A0ACC2RFL1_9FUNG|nr:Nitrogen permease regulator 3 [Entomophthora muscae]
MFHRKHANKRPEGTFNSSSRISRKESVDQAFGEASGIDAANSEFSMQNEDDGEGINSDEFKKQLFYDTVLGFDTSLIANIFSPKPALCNKRFQLGIQKLTFIGLPTLVPTSDGITQPSSSTLGGFPEGSGARSPDPYASNFSDVSSYSQITMFHVVFVLQTLPGSKGHQESHSFDDTLFENIVIPYTAALKREQARCDYIRSNAETIMSLTDLAKESGHSRDTLMRNILQTSTLAQEIAQIYNCLSMGTVAQLCINNYIHLALQIPPRFKHCTRRNGSLLVHPAQSDSLRDRIHSSDMSYTHRTAQSHHPQRQGSLSDPGSLLPSLRPYHSLLLLDTPEDLLRALPPDASPKLIRLIQILTPTQSLAELQIQLDCSLAYMFRLAAHLVFWQKARLIDVISVRNVYTLTPQRTLGYDELSDEFSVYFPQMNLCDILSFLSIPRPYSLIIPDKEQRTLYLEVIAFLLRRRVVVPLHTYIYFMVPQYIKRGYHSEDFERWLTQAAPAPSGGSSRLSIATPGGLEGMALDGIALVSSPAQMMEAEREWIKKVAHSQPKEVADLFQRLAKYFNGQYHVDEIVYYESITRRDLRAILSRFREELITVLHFRGIGESEHLLQ